MTTPLHQSEGPERGFLLHTFHRNQGDGTTLFGVGRLESGQTFALADSRQKPAFYLRASELARARPFCLGAGAELEQDTGLTTMDGEAVVRVVAPLGKDTPLPARPA